MIERIYTVLLSSSNQMSLCILMTSSNGNIFRVTSFLCGEFTGHRWIPLTKATGAKLLCFLWSAQTMETPVILDAMALIMTSLQWRQHHPRDFMSSNCVLRTSLHQTANYSGADVTPSQLQSLERKWLLWIEIAQNIPKIMNSVHVLHLL